VKPRKSKAVTKSLPLNFLLGCSQAALGTFELARLAEVADLRKQLHLILDRVIDQMSQAALVSWFKVQDRQSLKHAIENEESATEWAKRMIREGQRSGEELLPLPVMSPDLVRASHLTANIRYKEKNNASGLCQSCPQPLDPNSLVFCTKHLTKERGRHKRKRGKDDDSPGSINYLYQDAESHHGRELSNLAKLEMEREKKTRAFLAELGVAPESADVSLKAAKDALLKVMPESKASALPTAELFAVVPSRTTGQRALKELLSEADSANWTRREVESVPILHKRRRTALIQSLPCPKPRPSRRALGDTMQMLSTMARVPRVSH
jgi:hypothetical protein